MIALPERIGLFANPWAGSGRALGIARQLADVLQRQGYEVELICDKPEQINAAILDRPFAAITIFGGDGTIRAVLDRLSSCPFAIPPTLTYSTGTANLLASHLELNFSFDPVPRLAELLKTRKTIPFDAGIANGRLFLSMASAGFDATVVHELAARRKGPIRFTSYLGPTLNALVGERFPRFDVYVDGQSRLYSGGGLVLVANLSAYGTGFPIAVHARPDDGLLDVVVLPCRSRTELLSHVTRAMAGVHLQLGNALTARGKKVVVKSDERIPVQVDGDPGGFLPMEVTLQPARIPLIVPR